MRNRSMQCSYDHQIPGRFRAVRRTGGTRTLLAGLRIKFNHILIRISVIRITELSLV